MKTSEPLASVSLGDRMGTLRAQSATLSTGASSETWICRAELSPGPLAMAVVAAGGARFDIELCLLAG